MSIPFLAKVSVFVLAMSALVPMEAKALPFEPTPEKFTEYFNNVSWNSSSTFRFYNPHKCDFRTVHLGLTASCYVDYEETSSLGTRTCLSRELVYGIPDNSWEIKTQSHSYSNGLWTTRYTPGECGPWQQVSQITEPTKDAGQTPENIEETNPDTITKNELILAGSGVVLISSALAFAFGRISRKR